MADTIDKSSEIGFQEGHRVITPVLVLHLDVMESKADGLLWPVKIFLGVGKRI